MAGDREEPMEGFESWLLHRVAQDVEAGDVPADLLTELQAEFEAARARPEEEGHDRALTDIADRLEIPQECAEASLTALEAQSAPTHELMVRRIVETWFSGERESTANFNIWGCDPQSD